MSIILDTTCNELRSNIKSSLQSAIKSGVLVGEILDTINIEVPADSANGDFSTNIAMVLAKACKTSPRAVAEAVVQNWPTNSAYVDKIEIAGPGFINFYLNQKFYSSVLEDILQKGELYGRSNFGKGKRVLAEFVSANPTGPMTIGNARGGATGDSLASVLDFAGYYTEREFYVNDAGNQLIKLGKSLEARYLQIYKGEAIEFPEDGYQGQDVIDRTNEFNSVYGDKYLDSESQERQQALIDYVLPKNIKQLELDLLRYNIKYDTWFLESSLHNGGQIELVIKKLIDSGYTYENEGALWFTATKFGEEKDYVLRRSNGVVTYVVPDIVYHYNKLVTRAFDTAVVVLGADHHGYQSRLHHAMEAIGIDPARIQFVIVQMVRLTRDGELVKASKRTGKSITLSTLLDDIPVDACRFFFNLREPNTHLEFDLDLAIAQNSQNPVYYVQYAHARICSLIKTFEKESGLTVAALKPEYLDLLTDSTEHALIKYIANFTNEIITAAKTLDASKITKYLFELAGAYHKFYAKCFIKGEETDLALARLALCHCTKQVLANGLGMLKVTAPVEM